MGWTRQKASQRLWNHAWLVKSYRRGRFYDSHVITVLQQVYGKAEPPRDFLSDYLKETS